MKDSIKIMCIDDDEAFIDALGLILEMNKDITPVECFTDADKLLKALTSDVHICIVDYQLGGNINGLELIKLISEINHHCWFIMLSGIHGKEREEVLMKFMNISHGSRFIEKGTANTTNDLINCIGEIKRHINIVTDFYRNQNKIMEELSKIKNV